LHNTCINIYIIKAVTSDQAYELVHTHKASNVTMYNNFFKFIFFKFIITFFGTNINWLKLKFVNRVRIYHVANDAIFTVKTVMQDYAATKLNFTRQLSVEYGVHRRPETCDI